jgi:ATP phosphoribosyltransferase
MKKNLVLGISSGSLFDSTLALLRKIGIEVVISGRNFIAEIRGSEIFSRAIIMRPNDLPLALKNGIVDGIITGFDMCLESGLEKELCIIAKLNFSKKSKVSARIVIFCRENDSDEIVDLREVLVSSEYINLAKNIFKKHR